MTWREVEVGKDYRGRPYLMGYFHVEEVLASMRTEPTLRDHWVTRAAHNMQEVTWRVCRCTRPCEAPCGKATTPQKPHGARSARERVYHHPMDCDAAIDAQRKMQAAGHSDRDPLNVPTVLLTGEDKAKMTQFGGSF